MEGVEQMPQVARFMQTRATVAVTLYKGGDSFDVRYRDGLEGHVSARKDKQSGAWEVQSSEARRGFGPLLYVVAMEYASRGGKGLMPDRAESSDEAYAVWEKFLRGATPGVQATPIPKDWSYASTHDDPRRPALQMVFTKRPDDVMEFLRKQGRLTSSDMTAPGPLQRLGNWISSSLRSS